MKNKEKKTAWNLDQFFNPHETSHTLIELLEWFGLHGIKYVNFIPFGFRDGEKLFILRDRPSKLRFRFLEPLLTFNSKQLREGGFF